jgi:hypothetical protein
VAGCYKHGDEPSEAEQFVDLLTVSLSKRTLLHGVR